MHNLLINLSALMLLGAGILGFQNKQKLANEEEHKASAEKAVEANQVTVDEKTAEIADVEKKLKQTISQREAKENQLESLKSQADEMEQKLLEVEDNLRAKKAELESQKEKMSEIGDLKSKVDELRTLRSDNSNLASNVSSLEGREVELNQSLSGLSEQIQAYQKLLDDREKKVVPPSFSARVTRVRNEWGFAVINAGNVQGVVEGAVFGVQRGGEQIAQLKVASLLQNSCVADIVRGSLADGASIQVGDVVTAPSDSDVAKN